MVGLAAAARASFLDFVPTRIGARKEKKIVRSRLVEPASFLHSFASFQKSKPSPLFSSFRSPCRLLRRWLRSRRRLRCAVGGKRASKAVKFRKQILAASVVVARRDDGPFFSFFCLFLVLTSFPHHLLSPQPQATRLSMKASRSGECPSHGRRQSTTPVEKAAGARWHHHSSRLISPFLPLRASVALFPHLISPPHLSLT